MNGAGGFVATETGESEGSTEGLIWDEAFLQCRHPAIQSQGRGLYGTVLVRPNPTANSARSAFSFSLVGHQLKPLIASRPTSM
jgi:hypothetical protein